MATLPFNEGIVEFFVDFRSNTYSTPFTIFFRFLTFMGSSTGYFLLVLLLFWTYKKSFAFRVAVLMVISALINLGLKETIRNPRPFVEDGTYKDKWGLSSQSAIEETAQSYSTPSGHAQSAGTFYSYLDQRLSAKWTKIIYYSLIVLIGFSRVYLGVHYLEDVILGWLLGIGVTYVFMKYVEDKLPEHYKETSNNIIISLFAVTLALSLLVGYFDQWGQGAQDLTTFSGLFFGLVLGIKLEEHYIDFDARSKSFGNGIARDKHVVDEAVESHASKQCRALCSSWWDPDRDLIVGRG